MRIETTLVEKRLDNMEWDTDLSDVREGRGNSVGLIAIAACSYEVRVGRQVRGHPRRHAGSC
jgi:hypothetical protein